MVTGVLGLPGACRVEFLVVSHPVGRAVVLGRDVYRAVHRTVIGVRTALGMMAGSMCSFSEGLLFSVGRGWCTHMLNVEEAYWSRMYCVSSAGWPP